MKRNTNSIKYSQDFEPLFRLNTALDFYGIPCRASVLCFSPIGSLFLATKFG